MGHKEFTKTPDTITRDIQTANQGKKLTTSCCKQLSPRCQHKTAYHKTLAPLNFFFFFFFAHLFHLAQSAAPAGNLMNCHVKPKSLQNLRASLSLVHLVGKFSNISNVRNCCSNCTSGPFYKVTLLDPLVLTPCFSITQS